MKQIPFRVTFTLQADELQKEYSEVFWAKSARAARAGVHGVLGSDGSEFGFDARPILGLRVCHLDEHLVRLLLRLHLLQVELRVESASMDDGGGIFDRALLLDLPVRAACCCAACTCISGIVIWLLTWGSAKASRIFSKPVKGGPEEEDS